MFTALAFLEWQDDTKTKQSTGRQMWVPPSKRTISAATAVERLANISSDFLLFILSGESET